MDLADLSALADALTRKAQDAESGRAAETVRGGSSRALRQTVIALRAGASLAEHENPGEATVQVLTGRVRLVSGDDSVEAGAGELIGVPQAPHRLETVGDAVVLLTVAKLGSDAGGVRTG